MSDIRYPVLPGATWDLTWSPKFHTKIQSAVTGKEYRASMMANPLYSITIKYEFLRAGARQELRQLVGFYLARRGAYESFLFKLEEDCSVVGQAVGVGDGLAKSFQLVRSYGAFSEPVQNIDQVTEVRVNGNLVPPSGYSVSPTGLVTFAVPPVGPITWTGSYLYRVRFEDDEAEFNRFMSNLWKADSVSLIGSLGNRI
jgi:uncharacterized protein (TIGR02217 family)